MLSRPEVGLGAEGAVAVAEQHRDRVGAVVRDRQVGPAVAVQVADRDGDGIELPSRSRSSCRRCRRRSRAAPRPCCEAAGSPPPGRACRRRSGRRSRPRWDCLPSRSRSSCRRCRRRSPSSTETVLEPWFADGQVGLAVAVQVADRHGDGTGSRSRSRSSGRRCRRRSRAAPRPCWRWSFATARSGLPSPFRSADRHGAGIAPGPEVGLRAEGAVAVAEQHRDRVGVVVRAPPGRACRRRSGPRSRRRWDVLPSRSRSSRRRCRRRCRAAPRPCCDVRSSRPPGRACPSPFRSPIATESG